MRLWSVDILKYLPKKQLVSQWSEVSNILKNQTNHILINYIYDYRTGSRLRYAYAVLKECKRRGIKLQKPDSLNYVFESVGLSKNVYKSPYDFLEDMSFCGNPNIQEHDKEYLVWQFCNLSEKHKRGQKDFDKEQFEGLKQYVIKEIGTKENLWNIMFGDEEEGV